MIASETIELWRIHFENHMTNRRGWKGGYIKGEGNKMYENSYLQHSWEEYFTGRSIEHKESEKLRRKILALKAAN